MEEKNIVTVNEVRDLNTVTTEINTLVRQYRSLTLAYAVEVGRRLTEAKSLLPHGEWGAWLSERVSFSQRTANNLMRVFEEYGDTQITLLGAVPNSHAIANLPLTHAIKLLLLPAEEREEFVETEDVANMSTRELEEAIKARKAAEDRAEELEEEANRLNEDLHMIDAARSRAETELGHTKEELEKASAAVKAAEDAAEKAKKEAQKAKEKLKALKETAEVPREVLDKLTAEAEENAKAAAAEKLQKAIDDANAKIEAADRAKKDAEKKYEELRQQSQLSDPDVMAFKTLFEQVQNDAAKLSAVYKRIAEKSPEISGKLGQAVRKMVDTTFGAF